MPLGNLSLLHILSAKSSMAAELPQFIANVATHGSSHVKACLDEPEIDALTELQLLKWQTFIEDIAHMGLTTIAEIRDMAGRLARRADSRQRTEVARRVRLWANKATAGFSEDRARLSEGCRASARPQRSQPYVSQSGS